MDAVAILTPLFTVPLGTFVGAAVACGRRWPILWLWGFVLLGVVAAPLGFGIAQITFPAAVGWGLLALWLAIQTVALARAFADCSISARSRLGAGAASVAGGVLAFFGALAAQSVLYPVPPDFEPAGALLFVLAFVAFPLGAAGGWGLARWCATRIPHR